MTTNEKIQGVIQNLDFSKLRLEQVYSGNRLNSKEAKVIIDHIRDAQQYLLEYREGLSNE